MLRAIIAWIVEATSVGLDARTAADELEEPNSAGTVAASSISSRVMASSLAALIPFSSSISSSIIS